MITPEELDTIVDQCERWWHPSASSKDLADTAGRLVAEVRRLQKVTVAADRFCDCLNEFGAEGLRFCAEHLEELEKALEAGAARGRGE